MSYADVGWCATGDEKQGEPRLSGRVAGGFGEVWLMFWSVTLGLLAGGCGDVDGMGEQAERVIALI